MILTIDPPATRSPACQAWVDTQVALGDPMGLGDSILAWQAGYSARAEIAARVAKALVAPMGAAIGRLQGNLGGEYPSPHPCPPAWALPSWAAVAQCIEAQRELPQFGGVEVSLSRIQLLPARTFVDHDRVGCRIGVTIPALARPGLAAAEVVTEFVFCEPGRP